MDIKVPQQPEPRDTKWTMSHDFYVKNAETTVTLD